MRRMLLAIGILGLVATGCGRGASNQGLAQLNQTGFVSAAAAQSLRAGTAKLAMTMRVETPGNSSESFEVKGEGVMDFAKKLFDLKAEMPAISGISGTMEMVLVSDTAYMHVPAAVAKQMGIGAGKWIRFTKADTGGVDISGLSSFSDPTGLFEAIKSDSSSVKVIGQASIRGVKATEYLVTLDKQRLLSHVSGSQKDALTSMPVPQMKVYVSDDQLIRREEISYSAEGGSFAMTFDMYDYGAPANIKIPSASQIVDLKSLPQEFQN